MVNGTETSDNTGLNLRPYEYEPITNKEVFGRFGVSEMAEYGIEIGKEYLVMGLITFQTYQAYLIDDSGFISACPCQLFEVVDNKVNSNWHFRVRKRISRITSNARLNSLAFKFTSKKSCLL